MNAAFAAVSPITGRTLYRFVFKVGRTTRTCEQWHTDQDAAEAAAKVVAADWAGERKHSVLHVYPVPSTFAVNRCGGVSTVVGGP